MHKNERSALSEIYNLAMHGYMYVKENEPGNAGRAFESIIDIIKQQKEINEKNESTETIVSDDAFDKENLFTLQAITSLLKLHHLVIDLETLAVNDDARIIAIGAVLGKFSSYSPELFYKSIHMDDPIQDTRRIDASTVKWWFEQNEVARTTVKHAPCTTVDALLQFKVFIEKYANQHNIQPKDICVWGNGVDFDNAILLSLYKDLTKLGLDGFKAPFTFRQNMDARTIYNIMKRNENSAKEIVKPTNSHCALPDAEACFKTLSRFFMNVNFFVNIK